MHMRDSEIEKELDTDKYYTEALWFSSVPKIYIKSQVTRVPIRCQNGNKLTHSVQCVFEDSPTAQTCQLLPSKHRTSAVSHGSIEDTRTNRRNTIENPSMCHNWMNPIYLCKGKSNQEGGHISALMAHWQYAVWQYCKESLQ